jgi:hypothetical protein
MDANCLNIDGSFECKCKKGFVGDGHLSCERTCYEDCVHGKVQCISDLLTLEGIETIPIMAIMVVEFQVRDTTSNIILAKRKGRSRELQKFNWLCCTPILNWSE